MTDVREVAAVASEPPPARSAVAATNAAWRQMPVLAGLRRVLRADGALQDVPIALAVHVSMQTAHLMTVLRDGGARLSVHPSSARTVDPDAVEALGRRGIRIGVPSDDPALGDTLRAFGPRMLIDNGALLPICLAADSIRPDLIGATLHSRNAERTVAGAGLDPCIPVVPIADSVLKHAVETPAGTGQSTVVALVRATGIQLSGKQVVVIGYGTAGSGIARYLRDLRSRVTVVDTSAVACLRAVHDGHDIDSPDGALSRADVVLTATGARGVLTARHADLLPDGVVLGNVGHHRDEIDVLGLRTVAERVRRIGDGVEELVVNGRSLLLLGDGAQLNHVCGDGNSSEVMDLTLSLHVLALLDMLTTPASYHGGLNPLPGALTEQVARSRLRALGHVV